jgi:hypothetical protein
MAVELPVSGLASAAGRHLVNYLCSLTVFDHMDLSQAFSSSCGNHPSDELELLPVAQPSGVKLKQHNRQPPGNTHGSHRLRQPPP